jgi:hypothetical protein
MESILIILVIAFWVLCALAVICLMSLCYIKLIYFKWDKDEKELNRMINIDKHINSE